MSAFADLGLIDMQTHGRRAARGRTESDRAAAAVVAVGKTDSTALWSRGIRKRRSVPVRGYIGVSGHGKSASMVRDMLPSLEAGRTVLSTVEILDAWTGNPHPLYVPFRSFRQLEGLRNSDVLMDEISGIMDSHDAAMPDYVRRLLPQQRRYGNFVSWSGIDWDNSNRRLRQMTQAVTLCRGFFPDRSGIDKADGSVSLWAPNRLFSLRTYDAQKMMRSEDAQVLNRERSVHGQKAQRVRKPRSLVREWWRGSQSLAFRSYDTMGEVLGVDGGCEICGGRVPAKTCKGH